MFRYYDENGDEKLSIGSQKYFDTVMKTAIQLVEYLRIEHSEEQREKIMFAGDEQVMKALIATLNQKTPFIIHPN